MDDLDRAIAYYRDRLGFELDSTDQSFYIKPLEERPWARRDFYVEDPDGYILCFSEQNA